MPVAQNKLPMWRGFNLLYFFSPSRRGAPCEDDFKWISNWGFNFVRLPLCYRLWTDPADWFVVRERALEWIDMAVDLGRKYRVHVNLAFHRAPGYCVNPDLHEPSNLWDDQTALDAFCFHWQLFARRYKGISSSQISFNLVNEPGAPNSA